MNWCWGSFFRKLTSRKFWVWLATTIVTHAVMTSGGDHPWITAAVVVWGIISVIYLCGEVVIDAMGKAIEKADIGIKIGGPK